MKKIFLAFALLISLLGFSQQEIKLDVADALIIRSLEFSYEKYLSEESFYRCFCIVQFNQTRCQFPLQRKLDDYTILSSLFYN